MFRPNDILAYPVGEAVARLQTEGFKVDVSHEPSNQRGPERVVRVDQDGQNVRLLVTREAGPEPDAALPAHVAIIADGNGRWARARGLPREAGHRAGAENVRSLVRSASAMGLQVLTIYAFSTENWRRPRHEINALWRLLVHFLRRELAELHQEGVRVIWIGSIDRLPPSAQETLRQAREQTQYNAGLTLCLALNYGSRNELVRAVRQLGARIASGGLRPEDIDEETISEALDTRALPDPDLVIRTSGEYRLSNFLLWQAAYAELYVTDVLFPEFGEPQLKEAVRAYQARHRRFGGLDQEGR